MVWPAEPEDTRIVVSANPLHPDTQKLVSTADGAIQRAVAIAERKAQAAYDERSTRSSAPASRPTSRRSRSTTKALPASVIDAELELAIEVPPAASYEVGSSDAPVVTAWSCRRDVADRGAAQHLSGQTDADRREHFRPRKHDSSSARSRRPRSAGWVTAAICRDHDRRAWRIRRGAARAGHAAQAGRGQSRLEPAGATLTAPAAITPNVKPALNLDPASRTQGTCGSAPPSNP